MDEGEKENALEDRFGSQDKDCLVTSEKFQRSISKENISLLLVSSWLVVFGEAEKRDASGLKVAGCEKRARR